MVPAENVEQLKQVGFFRALQPKAYGGLELDLADYAECIVALAQGCPSTAWACGLLANHSHAIALFSTQAQQEIWGEDADALVSSSVAPLGKWEEAEGGILLSGKFGWSSGCDYAQWAVLGFMGKNNVGQPGPCFAVVPRSEYEILDDWDSMALRGTGSKSMVLDKVFVPEHRIESLFALNYGLSKGFKSHSAHIYLTPFSPVFSIGFAAVALGAAQRFASVFKEKTQSRIRAYTGAKAVESVPTLVRLAESVNQISAAQALLRKDWADMAISTKKGSLPLPENVLDWRVNQAYAIKILIESVDRLFAACGGSSWAADSELQRLFRDIHITGCHAQTDYDIAAQTYGRYLADLPADSQLY